ncbi:MAG: hypothetical protein Q7T81_15850 [Pseudolabrys sp.]|nr:hypothetical protein [Pseudolabrys sp.]
MPRYYFHFSDGKRRFSDAEGRDLSGMAAARTHAIAQVRDIKAAISDNEIQDLRGWSMTVEDGGGQTVFETSFDLKLHGARH